MTEDTVRFRKDGKFGEWKKGQIAKVVDCLTIPPQNQNSIYVIELENGTRVWATEKDVEFWNQLTLF